MAANSIQLTLLVFCILSGAAAGHGRGQPAVTCPTGERCPAPRRPRRPPSRVCSLAHCTDPARCTPDPRGRGCRCAKGFYGDHCDKGEGSQIPKTPVPDPRPRVPRRRGVQFYIQLKVVCGKDYITMWMVEDFFKYYDVPLESLRLPNKSCGAQREVVGGVPYYMARISKEKYAVCGGKPLEKNITHISYSLTLLSDARVVGNIVRDPVIRIQYTCVYPYTRSVSLTFPVIPLPSETLMRMDELEATVGMTLYTDASYTSAYSRAPSIQLSDKVYVEVSVTEPKDFFVLGVERCWATQTPQPNATEQAVHTLLHNGCANDETVTILHPSAALGRAAGRAAGPTGDRSVMRFSFDMFRFVLAPHDLYLHCSIQLCEPDDHALCTPICKSIIKREAVRADHAHGLLSYGPIRVEMPDPQQSSLLKMVVLPMAGIWTLGLFFLILLVVAKAGRRRMVDTVH
ncbi:unnamed protein product [Merluccius merluccius]